MPRTITSDWFRRRWDILRRDNFTCRYCGQSAPNVVLEVDHVVAVMDGGTDDSENLVTACRACNQGKGASEWAIARTLRPAVERHKPPPFRVGSKTHLMAQMIEADPRVSDEKIAEATGMTVVSVRTLRFRIRRKMPG